MIDAGLVLLPVHQTGIHEGSLSGRGRQRGSE
jgi:hypothetical protein